jgi:hypothetical protein
MSVGDAKAKPRATVRVRLTIEMDAAGVWGADCSIGQVHRQARETVENALRQGLVIHGLECSGTTKTPAVIVGDPQLVMTVIDARSS